MGLAYVLRDRYEKTHDTQDLDEAEAVSRQCIAELPGHTSLVPVLKSFLKMVLELRLQAVPEIAVREEILQLASEVSNSTAAPPLVRALQARDAAVMYAENRDWRTAAEQFELVVSLVLLAAPDDDLREGIRVLLPGRVAADGVACWLNAGEPEHAAVLAELGRAVFISRATAVRAQLGPLRARQPDLARRFETLRARLNKPDPSETALAGLWDEPVPPVDRVAIAAEMEELLITIRDLPHHERFMLPPRVGDLLAAAADGPLILLNASKYRCDALILTVEGVRIVPLGEEIFNDLVQRATRIQMAVFDEDSAETTEEILVWLWVNVVEPVLLVIGITARPPASHWPRIWWIPDGPFSWLPIHAAGNHRYRHTIDPPTLLDRAQSSYTPSIGMLVHARELAQEIPKSGEVLIVAMPKTPGELDLPAVANEVHSISGLFPATILGTIPGAHGPATRDAIINELLTHPVAHFSCHAHGDWDDPWRSFLAIQSGQSQPPTAVGPLYLTDIASLNLQGRRLACLSACATSRPTQVRLLDEAVHLTSGFLLAGFTHVTGTLWEAEDQAAAEFFHNMYSRLKPGPSVADPRCAAMAVHEATRALREQHVRYPVLWASYIYVGP